ncbi:MAG: glycerol-3-phosphate dehydrogenase [Polyangiaceae bacterium]|nr:glycerol-3-phosphate dehydrogenase [Polyangiaceae bacterium]
MTSIVILGAGMMGTALAFPLADNLHDVRLVGTHLDDEIVASLKKDGTHPKLGLQVPQSVRPFFHHEIEAAAEGAQLWALGVSSAGIPWATQKLSPYMRRGTPLFMITKGLVLEGSRLETLPDVVRASLPDSVRADIHPAAIAGPCIAGELARRVPSCVVLAGRDKRSLTQIADAIRAPYYHPFPTTDVVGAEVCAALKNAYAMGIGFAAGMHEKRGGAAGSVAMHNLESATMAQAVLEMRRIVVRLGGDPDTVSGLAGVGDLDVTTNGGRTGRFGKLLGQGLSRNEAVAAMQGATLECLEILAVMKSALIGGAIGRLSMRELPLLGHLIDVALDGAPVHLPLERFFQDEVA